MVYSFSISSENKNRFSCFFSEYFVVVFIIVIGSHAVCISFVAHFTQRTVIESNPEYTHTRTHTHKPIQEQHENGVYHAYGWRGCKSKIKGLQFLFVFLCVCVRVDWLCFGESLYFRFDGCPLYLCNGNRLSVYV